MRLVAKIKRVTKSKRNGFLRLSAEIRKSAADTVKLAHKLRGKKISIEREFPKDSPEPKAGELVILGEQETRDALARLIKPAKIASPAPDEVLALYDDTNSDGYPELVMKNSFIELQASPVRGGLITHFAETGREGLISNQIILAIKTKVSGGIFIKSHGRGDFSPKDTKFKDKTPGEGKLIRSKTEFKAILKGKVGGLNTQLSYELFPESPVLKLAITIDNSGKKSKSKSVRFDMLFNCRQVGLKNSGIELFEPSGKTKHFAQKTLYRVWEIMDEWIDYQGDVRTDRDGFVVLKRTDTGEGLLVSFNHKDITRVWMDEYGIMPQIRLIFNKYRIGKNKKADREVFLTPLTDFTVDDGYLIGYTKGSNGIGVIAAGDRISRLNLIYDGEKTGVKLEQIARKLFAKTFDKTPRAIEFPRTGMRLEIEGGNDE